MKVKDLKKLVSEADDEMDVLIPVNQEFDGRFYLPCSFESGVCAIAADDGLTGEDDIENELLCKEPNTVKVFMLVPCGFHDEKDHSHELN